MPQPGRKKMNWKLITVGIVLEIIVIGTLILLTGCAKSADEVGVTSGNRASLPVTLNLLIEHAQYSKDIYDSTQQESYNPKEVGFWVTQDNGITIIKIRGTDNYNNIMTDIDVRLVKDPELGIYFHKGFLDAAAMVMQSIDNDLSSVGERYFIEHTVHITGHSLGGATAQIIGMWLHKRGHNVQVFSYGSPKVSSEVLSGGQPTHWRVVNTSDPITFMPFWPYRHTGVFINVETLDWGPDNDNGLISETDGLDHSISKYVITLKRQL